MKKKPLVYLDNAATGFPKSKTVIAALCKASEECANAGRSGYSLSVRASRCIYGCRERLAELFSAKPERTVLCMNATHALNTAIKGIIKKGAAVAVSDMEHNAVMRPVYAVGTPSVFTVDLEDDTKTLESFGKCLNRGVSAAVVTHASNVCGKMLPIYEMAEMAREKGIPFIVDASQTAGHTRIAVDGTHITALCFAGHKGLYGPMGTGALILNSEYTEAVSTLLEGGTGVSSFEHGMPIDYPERLEAGTMNAPAFAALSTACDELEYGAERERGLLDILISGLKNMKDIELYGAKSLGCEAYMPVLVFNKSGVDAEALASYLGNKGICVRAGFHCAPLTHLKLGTASLGAVRISLGRSNNENDIDKLLTAVSDYR